MNGSGVCKFPVISRHRKVPSCLVTNWDIRNSPYTGRRSLEVVRLIARCLCHLKSERITLLFFESLQKVSDVKVEHLISEKLRTANMLQNQVPLTYNLPCERQTCPIRDR